MKYEVNVVDGCAYLHGSKRKGETSSYLLMDASIYLRTRCTSAVQGCAIYSRL
jgi:hypothetical protein